VTLYRLLSTIWNSLSVNDSAEPVTDVGAARGRSGDHSYRATNRWGMRPQLRELQKAAELGSTAINVKDLAERRRRKCRFG
jgi:hypothetical protein